MKKILILAFLLNITYPCSVVSQLLPLSLGNLKSIKKTVNGISIATDYGNLKVTIYSPNIIKINATLQSSFNDFSYAVVASPITDTKYDLKDLKDSIIITTDSLKLLISKRPVRLSLFNNEGELVNADEESLGTEWIGDHITTYKKLFPDEKFIGLGEKTGDLNRRGSGYVNWNSDVPGYELRQDPLYCSIPFYIGIHDSLVYGMFLDNSSKTHFNFGASQERFSSFSVEDGDMNYFLIYHSNVAKIIESYTWLTGRMPLPPLWSLGYHQCRWSYYPESVVMSLAQTFRDKKIPCDAIWFDIHYMNDYKVFTWDRARFPDPKGMLDKLETMGFKNVSIIDPGIKAEEGYFAYDEGLKKDLFLQYPDGTVYKGQVWPGWCAFTDYTKPEARVWWGKLFDQNVREGLDGFWCDMNEIATWGQKTPDNILLNFDGSTASYRLGKNIYGLQMTRATYEGSKQLFNNKRPFLLTRAGFAGLQRYTAIWTGDNLAKDDHMLLGVRLLNSFGLSGVSFAGVDVGGFIGEASPALMARWISIGAFSPFFRSHKEYNSKDAEPWSFGEHTESVSRNYIQLRYKLLPYIYSSFYESAQTGMPVQRSLAIDYSFDEKIYSGSTVNEYFFGPSLLVIPCLSSQLAAPVYLPAGEWYELYSDTKHTGNHEFYYDSPVEKLPVFVKAGSVIPVQSSIQSTSQKPNDTLTLHVYNGNDSSTFVYYEDAGDGYDFEKEIFIKRDISFYPHAQQIVLEKSEGNFNSHFKSLKIVFHGFESIGEAIAVNGTSVQIIDNTQPIIENLFSVSTLPSIIIANSTGLIVVRY